MIVLQDVRQVVWDMHHMMQEDERRRFTFGFTIEKNSMRLWYVSRSDIFISGNFDFVSVSRGVLSCSKLSS